jgi:hypothetical protein
MATTVLTLYLAPLHRQVAVVELVRQPSMVNLVVLAVALQTITMFLAELVVLAIPQALHQAKATMVAMARHKHLLVVVVQGLLAGMGLV